MNSHLPRLARVVVLVTTYLTIMAGLAGIFVGYSRLSTRNFKYNAALYLSSTRMVLASRLVVFAAAIVLPVINRSGSRRTGRAVVPEKQWRRILATIEGVSSLACLLYLITATVGPESRYEVPRVFIIVWALGTGMGIGALRFGDPNVRLMGGIAVSILVGILILFTARGDHL